jgi:hypothetical protein
MQTRKRDLANCRTGAPVALVFAFVFGLAVVEAPQLLELKLARWVRRGWERRCRRPEHGG